MIKIGVSNFAKSSLKRKLTTVHVKNQKKTKQKDIKFNEITTVFPPQEYLDKLTPIVQKILELLEVRSLDNNGDTKIYDARIAKSLNVSCATVKRALRKLESVGLIRRHTVKTTNNVPGHWKSIRTIRCMRVFLKSDCNFIRKLPWKRDERPDFHMPKHIGKGYLKKIYPLRNYFGINIIPANVYNPEIDKTYRKLNDERHWYEFKKGENNKGIDVLGYFKETVKVNMPDPMGNPFDVVYNNSTT